MSDELSTTILLIEDNDDDVFAMKRALKLAGVTNPVQIVNDGQGARDYLLGQGEYADRDKYPLPFIVFLDLKLPYVDGFEILAWMSRVPALSAIVVVVLTSSAEDRDHERAYALGARSYVVKPPTAEGLKDIFDSLSSYWHLRGNSPLVPAKDGRCSA